MGEHLYSDESSWKEVVTYNHRGRQHGCQISRELTKELKKVDSVSGPMCTNRKGGHQHW